MARKNKMEFCFAVRMRMFPSHRQEQVLWKNLNASRFIYNQLLANSYTDSAINKLNKLYPIPKNCWKYRTVKGKKVTQSTSTYKVDADIEPSLVPDAVAKSIDNELITYRAIAENVTSFATYWYGRRYRYDFDWRQNPAVELLDTITVHDDFERNNGVYITDRELEYNNGVLSGNSKGVY